MRMLNEADDNDVSVSWADQQRINKFSRTISKLQDVEYDLKLKRDEKEALDDLAMEFELVDEDDKVLYKIGSTFVHVPQAQALEMLERDNKKVEEEIEQLGSAADSCNEEMKKLKVELYAKFGNNINLERD
ncbi:putative GIM3-Gim complex component [Tilletiaria anomala UBC 951]|uniref:Prefoldin subunit 4 n=1 Tax=Tilletiaria anomala (strain ATCC 24038 / CBS 436.72 / UBC 951) TaxID=1037660 RepID=A0A066WER8_TILAU|nr:putative GIM3-Gim complex component [Tilletiaria anomala UBC 951]KDN49245.1 putative GIM3-Gim complex component [Tilletiaria anomala UBC 951]